MPLLNMASTPRRSPRLASKRTYTEAEMESPTIRKVRACFGEAENQLFSPIQECLTLFLLLCQWLPATLSTASLATSSQPTQPDYRQIIFFVLQETYSM